jgi:NADH-quinone oxidoreductase chain G
MIAVYINNMQKLVNKKSTILQACKTVGVQIPRFCYHEQLSIAGNCRMCLVEVSTAIKPVASCALQVVEGQKIFTNTKLVTKAREGVLEFLLANHPLDCPICDQGGECDLQDQALLFGKDRGRFYEFKRAVSDKNCGPLIKTIMTRCIHCTRCVRFLSELAGTVELGTTGRGVKTEIGNYITKSIISEVSGNIIDLCPVGALTSKPYAFTTRSWELMKTETIDTFDSMCSNIVVHSYGQRLMRVLPILNESVNQEWINDKTRFGYDILFKKRLFYSYVILEKSKGLTRVSWLFVYKSLLILYNLFTNRRNLALIGNDISLETGFILKYNSNLSLIQHQIFDKHFFIHSIDFKSSYLFLGGYLSFSKADCIVLCGVNLRVEMPLLLIRLRKSIYQYRLKVALFGRLDNYFLKLAHLGNTILSFFFFTRTASFLFCF